MRDRRFLMIPFHLIGATDLGSAILGGYAREARRLGLSAPPVYRSDAMLADARNMRERLGDEQFAGLLGIALDGEDEGDLPNLDRKSDGGWTTELLDQAFTAPYGDEMVDSKGGSVVPTVEASGLVGFRCPGRGGCGFQWSAVRVAPDDSPPAPS
ncbi:hypothetical protein [Actinomadura harenae]|uniref:Uncharacterized protein n=1 Tax=Actinomadura harenae TaxID=2483351 RepID=A0A3M2MC17_9ACTN|nr:hypothetical protein [Actinomadura harenae]RMI47264.1 hypothetical protein EBO15_03510 [Actinomadura harenae]